MVWAADTVLHLCDMGTLLHADLMLILSTSKEPQILTQCIFPEVASS